VRARWDGHRDRRLVDRDDGRREHDPRDTRTGILPRALDELTRCSRETSVSGARTGINVEWWHDGQGLDRNTFAVQPDRLGGKGGSSSTSGTTATRSSAIPSSAARGRAIVLQGTSDNVVRRNVGCGAGGEALVREQSAYYDNGARAGAEAEPR
jgi:hypothetical protein